MEKLRSLQQCANNVPGEVFGDIGTPLDLTTKAGNSLALFGAICNYKPSDIFL